MLPVAKTPVLEAPRLEGTRGRLWIKQDGLTHALYGGNKLRKLGRIFAEAERSGARRVLTFGAAGSHHVLSTALYASSRGLPTAAVLTPQLGTEHAVDTLRAIVAQGVAVRAAPLLAAAPLAFLFALQRGDYVIPPGASNVSGALGYVDAVAELADQIGAGELPEPDWIVTPIGSGGTAAGLLAGVLRHGLKSRVLGVLVAGNPLARPLVVRLARRCLATFGAGVGDDELSSRLSIDASEVGPGYGRPTPAAEAALALAASTLNLELDVTYTAKAFAAALSLLRRREERVLYWHTLSSAPLAPLLEGAPSFAELPARIRALIR